MTRFPTPIENIALNLIYEFMQERGFPTYWDFLESGADLPPLKVLHEEVNLRLKKIAKSSQPPYEICRFRDGDEIIRYDPFPTSISMQTIRTALIISGMRERRWTPTRS